MGPLVPDVISQGLNFVIAFFIGLFFGAILEQAGFSSSRRLVGLFYGYDFTVLRVFFTAGAVAMIGIFLFETLGLIDMSAVYINPTYLWSAVVGGLIMGLGFVVGGYCPGTSVCAASIGKIDAIVFILGAIVGVLVFAEGYKIFEPLYKSSFLGSPRIFETLNISQQVFAFLLVIMALAAFYFTNFIENRVNKIQQSPLKTTPYFAVVLVIGTVVALSSFVMYDKKDMILKLAEDKDYVVSATGGVCTDKNPNPNSVCPDEFALCLIRIVECNKVQIFDFRKPEDRNKLPFPKSIPATVEDLFSKEFNRLLRIRGRDNIFIAKDEFTERKMLFIAKSLGYERIKFLKGGVDGFISEILNYQENPNPMTKEEKYKNQFRLYAKQILPDIFAKSKPSDVAQPKKKRPTMGGC